MPDQTVTDHADRSRFELATPAGPAFLDYRREGDRVLLLHTEVPDAVGGQGLGTALVRGALDQVRAAGQRAVALCPFVHDFVDRHPEYGEVVVE